MSNDAATNAAGVAEGDVLAGKYRIDKVLGVGGMGVVVAAHHLHLDERVAIKFLLPEAMQNAETVERFAREARAAVKIKNEHVARVIDVGKLDTGAPYMVMEFLEGADLAAMLETSGPLPLEKVVEYVLQACEAIAEAHSLGIVHRDLKPANLFATRRSDGVACIKVLDFGISKMTNTSASSGGGSMTRTTAVMGSPLYMSPEQLASAKDVDARTDIWAIGVILYELLSGTVPFEGDSLPQLCTAVVSMPHRPLRDRRPDLPARVDTILSRCLAKDRANRYADVAELAEDLASLSASPRARMSVERISVVLSSSQLEPVASVARARALSRHDITNAEFGSTKGPMPRKTLAAVSIGAGVLALGLAVTVAVLLSRGSGAAPEAVAGSTSGAQAAAARPVPEAPAAKPVEATPTAPVASVAPAPPVAAEPESPKPVAAPAPARVTAVRAPSKPKAPAAATKPSAARAPAPAKADVSGLIDDRR